MQTHYRRLNSFKELKALQQREKECFGMLFNYIPFYLETIVRSTLKGFLAPGLRKVDILLQVDTKTNQPVGHISYQVEANQTIHIHLFLVYKEYQRQGYGLEMMTHFIEAFRLAGVRNIILETRASNKAMQQLLIKTGFDLDWLREVKYNIGTSNRNLYFRYRMKEE